jgi:hypothetical protein
MQSLEDQQNEILSGLEVQSEEEEETCMWLSSPRVCRTAPVFG